MAAGVDQTAFRELPAIDLLVRGAREGGSRLADEPLRRLLQEVLAGERDAIAIGGRPNRAEIVVRAMERVREIERPRLGRILNATGVVVHTNLGRALVSAEAAAAMAAAAGAVALEVERETNERGGRMREITDLLRLLTGAEAALVVNNCAAAVVLVLSAIASGKRVIVSRGEAVEIGGGFRVPDVLRQSGAELVEVGTTNRTYAADYAAATDERTGAYLKVHPSNFQVIGFVHAASTAELTELGRARGVPVLEDLGSGALLDTTVYGLAREPMLGESLAAGAALVMVSGDKLLGGPQAGIIAGSATWVDLVSRHPLARAMRADKTCLAGLAATLRHYLRGEAEVQVPVWRMIGARPEALQERAERLRAVVAKRGVCGEIESAMSTVGGGSLPGEELPTVCLSLGGDDLDRLAARLRLGEPGVFGRIEHGRLLLDLRTVLPEDDAELAAAVIAAVVE